MSDSQDQAQAIQALPQDWAVLKLENETIMAMAAARPRDYAAILKSIQDQVDLFPEFAERALYSRPVGKDPVTGRPVFATGLSIRAAEAIAEAYGFNRVRASVSLVNPDLASIEATFVDYQRGRMWSKNVLVSRFQKRRDGDTYRLSDERFQLLQDAKASIVIREVILRSVPPGLRAALEAKVRASIRLDPERIGKILGTFASKKVDKVQLELFLGRPSEHWTNEDRHLLLETLTAIEDGEASVESIFAPASAEEVVESKKKEEPKKPVGERAKAKLRGTGGAGEKRPGPEQVTSAPEPLFHQPEDGDGPPPGFE